MNLINMAIVLVRLYGLLLIFYCIESIQQAVVFYVYSSPSADAILRSSATLSITNAILCAVVGLGLLKGAGIIACWVVPRTARENESVVISVDDLALVTFSLAGIFFFVDGVRWFVHDGAVWLPSLWRNELGAHFDVQMIASLIASAFKITIGLLLLFGARNIVTAIRWVRQAGIRRPVQDTDESKADKVKEANEPNR